MNETMRELQRMTNELNQKQFELMANQIKMLLMVVEDHENDMKKMADKINELERQISQRA